MSENDGNNDDDDDDGRDETTEQSVKRMEAAATPDAGAGLQAIVGIAFLSPTTSLPHSLCSVTLQSTSAKNRCSCRIAGYASPCVCMCESLVDTEATDP